MYLICWLALVAWAASIAAGRDSEAAAFARGFVSMAIAGLITLNFEGNLLLDRGRSGLMESYWYIANFSLLVGLLGGALSLWRYQRNERHENRPNP